MQIHRSNTHGVDIAAEESRGAIMGSDLFDESGMMLVQELKGGGGAMQRQWWHRAFGIFLKPCVDDTDRSW